MIKDRETLETIFNIVKNVKKPIIAVYPDGRVIGTDEQFASLNELVLNVDSFNINIPYIFVLKELSAFMRDIKDNNSLMYNPYEICAVDDKISLRSGSSIERQDMKVLSKVINHIEMSSQFFDLYNKVLGMKSSRIVYQEENFQLSNPEVISLKVSDGAITHFIGDIMMTSFNAIHPATKTDRIDLIIRDLDEYSYVSEFIIYKKKGNYEIHEYLRFRKI